LGSQDLLSELVDEAFERFLGRRRGHLAVDVHRHGDLAVPQDCHRHPRVDVQGNEQRRARPPSCMHGYDGDETQSVPPEEAPPALAGLTFS